LSRDQHLSDRVVSHTKAQSERYVQGVEHAVRLVGFDAFRSFLHSTLAPGQSTVDSPTLTMMQGALQEHCSRVAICSHMIAKEVRYPNPSEAYTAGLLHDVGRALLNAYAYDELQSALKLTQAKAISMVSAEDQGMGINHAYLGGKLLTHWGLPVPIVEAVVLHHSPTQVVHNRRLAKIVHLADVAVNCVQARLPVGIALFPMDKAVVEELRVTKEKLTEFARRANELILRVEQGEAAEAEL
jgi:putative nucleotidyltransferase with HDIG domain